MSEIAAALEEAIARQADTRLRRAIDGVFDHFSKSLSTLFHDHATAAPPGVGAALAEMSVGVFDALVAAARLRAAEALLLRLSSDDGGGCVGSRDDSTSGEN
jgi:hypothetical protein